MAKKTLTPDEALRKFNAAPVENPKYTPPKVTPSADALRTAATRAGKGIAQPAPVNNKFWSTGSSAAWNKTDNMGKVQKIINGVYEAPKSGPGVIKRTAGAAKRAGERVVSGVKAANASAAGSTASGTAKLKDALGAAKAASAAPVAGAASVAAPTTPAVKASMARRAAGAVGTGLGRVAAGVGRVAKPIAVVSGAAKSGMMSGEERARFNNELGVTDSNSLAGNLANNTANTAFQIGNTLTFGMAEKLGQGISSAVNGGGFREGWNQKTFDERGASAAAAAEAAEKNPVIFADGDNAPKGFYKNPASDAQKKSIANAKFERARQAMAAQAPGVGSVDLGAGEGYGGGGVKRNSLASSVDANGVPTYDNTSIARMLARNAGPGGWTADNMGGAQEATRLLQRRAGGPMGGGAVGIAMGGGGSGGSRSSGGGGGGAGGAGGAFGAAVGGGDDGEFRAAPSTGYSNPRGISGDTRGAEQERQQRLSDIDSALFSMRGKPLRHRGQQAMFMQLQEMKKDLTSQAYGVQNERDVAGAKMANEGAQFGADLAEKGAERRDKSGMFNAEMGWDKSKFAIERADKIAAAEAEARKGPDGKELREDAKFKYGELEMRDKEGRKVVSDMAMQLAVAAGRDKATPEDTARAAEMYAEQRAVTDPGTDDAMTFAGQRAKIGRIAEGLNQQPFYGSKIRGAQNNLTAGDISAEDIAAGKYGIRDRGGVMGALSWVTRDSWVDDKEIFGPDGVKGLKRSGSLSNAEAAAIEPDLDFIRDKYKKKK